MRKQVNISFGILILLSLLLAACGSTSSPTPTATAVLPTGTAFPTATAIPPTATATATRLPVDWQAAWKDFLAGIPATYYLIEPADLHGKIVAGNAPFIIDVRETSEVTQTGYIHGAVNLPIRGLMQNLDALPALDQAIVVYDSNGVRDTMAMAALRLAGYTNVLRLDGGLVAWSLNSLPLDSGTPTTPEVGSAAAVDSNRVYDLDAFLSTLPDNFYGMINTDAAKTFSTGNLPNVIDLRSSAQVSQTGSVPGGILLPINKLLDDMTKLPADKSSSILTISQDGQNAVLATMALRMLGYTDVDTLIGGINGWIQAGLAIP